MVKPVALVVDDEESMRYFLTRALRKKGWEVTAVGTGEEGVAALADRAADVVLLDLKLPGKDGVEVLGEIRRIRPGTVVVMMTGYGTVERALEAMRLGAADFVTKPFRVEDVLGKVEAARRKGAPARPKPEPRAETTTAAPAGGKRMPPPRPLVPFLVETAEKRGVVFDRPEGGDLPYREAARLFETLYFLELFERTAGNVSLAARIAGVSRPSLHRKIHDLEIDVDRYRE